jgi:hypothetical protein
MIKYWSIGTGETGEYFEEGEHNDFPRGVYLVYSNCCLTTGFKTRKEAFEFAKAHPCEKHPFEAEKWNENGRIERRGQE